MIKLSKQANRLALCCILVVFILVFILGSLDSWGIKNNRELIDIVKTTLLFSLPFLGYWAAIKLPNPKEVNDVKLLPNTKNIRVSFYKTSGFIDRNNQISFVRFFFDEGIIYMYFSNVLRIYEGPFYIKEKNKAELGMFYIHSLSNYVNEELTLEIKPKNSLDSHYKLTLSKLSKIDCDLIKVYIHKI
ncbi:hypothetical protein HNQ02_000925 [Flavobacterium sp. 7E]|uniref:hypothetical protein n=1 Tax=unclassified Flavobacterium TaxID=196869 RepID=UPI0015713C98|nr:MULTISPECIES: hypothetical protein [unclassified Flavobacterium]NRS88015.1 hypothetical protein [Flavobacterium sp. 7E]NRT14576.1 hypothetical protein [Flavobacterium sp. 28A]